MSAKMGTEQIIDSIKENSSLSYEEMRKQAIEADIDPSDFEKAWKDYKKISIFIIIKKIYIGLFILFLFVTWYAIRTHRCYDSSIISLEIEERVRSIFWVFFIGFLLISFFLFIVLTLYEKLLDRYMNKLFPILMALFAIIIGYLSFACPL